MKPESIEERRRRKKREARRGVAAFALLQLACGACMGALCFIPELPTGWKVLFGALAAFCLLLILPALWALSVRYREIESGEDIESQKY